MDWQIGSLLKASVYSFPRRISAISSTRISENVSSSSVEPISAASLAYFLDFRLSNFFRVVRSIPEAAKSSDTEETGELSELGIEAGENEFIFLLITPVYHI